MGNFQVSWQSKQLATINNTNNAVADAADTVTPDTAHPANGFVDAGALLALADSVGLDKDTDLEGLIKLAGQLGKAWKETDADLQQRLEKATKQLRALSRELKATKESQAELTKQINAEKANLAKAPQAKKKAIQDNIDKLEKQLAQAKDVQQLTESMLKSLVTSANASKENVEKSTAYTETYATESQVFETELQIAADQLGLTLGASKGPGTSKAATTKGGATGNGTTQQKADGKAAAQNAQPQAGAFGQPRAATGTQGPNPQAFGNWWNQQDAKMAAFDDMNKLQGQSNKMMMLFFFLARMAMSGDMGAMYQFLRFVGFIINKDKAMQNVQMAKKLIDLQDQSRKLTQMLVDTPSYDKDNPDVQNNYSKMMEQVKADQGVIGTEQKLIAGMLEEMSQVSEMMTNMTKALLDARGRELQVVSSWRV